MNLDVEIFKGEDGKWYWRVKSAGNHETLGISEGFENRLHALDMATRIFKPDNPETRTVSIVIEQG